MTDLDKRLKDHLGYAIDHAPAVQAIFEKAGLRADDVQTVADLQKLPVVSKDHFVEMQQANPPFGGWLGVPMERLQRIYLSPGPIFDPLGLDDAESFDDVELALSQAGFDKGDIVVNAFLYHMVPAGLFFDEGLRRVGAVTVPMGPGNTETQIKVMLDLKVAGYVGTPSFLAMILDKMTEMGIPKSAIPLKKAFFSAEPYPPSLRAKFEGDYGLKTSQAYATADLGIVAYEVYGEKGFILPKNLIVELVDPQTGQWVEEGTPGEVVVTSFSKVYPLLRFGTGDMAVMIPGAGRLFGLVGRSGEAVKVRGMFLHPNQLRFATASFVGIAGLQAVVTREGTYDHVTLKVAQQAGATVDEEALKAAIKQVAHLSINAVEFVETIEGQRLIVDERIWD
ncbi:MAG: phenylacetate--CoA ligase family protein [Chloroflexi bacterium]|nr:phenylacetate--CoA ligase family protein [Chloroflexota bacterium]